LVSVERGARTHLAPLGISRLWMARSLMRRRKVQYHQLVRTKIENIIESRSSALWTAIRQRAKFEGWLKIELAAALEEDARVECQLEAPVGDGLRCDLFIDHDLTRLYVELKTIGSSWRVPCVENKTKDTTNNIRDVIADVEKLRRAKEYAKCVVAFVEFPVPEEGEKCRRHLKYISEVTKVPFGDDDCYRLMPIEFEGEIKCNVLVCACEV
jgi:hypothetical protein